MYGRWIGASFCTAQESKNHEINWGIQNNLKYLSVFHYVYYICTIVLLWNNKFGIGDRR